MTILFTDVVGSTNLAEELDPETFRLVMARYFEDMQVVLTRHGGVTEKFIGDAIMAVFGVPRAHEDDALRAVRAAAEMRDRLRLLNESLARDLDVRVLTRTGVHTGEVITGDPEGGTPFATGDPVNVAARLEQMAAPGEILISDTTHWLVQDFATTEPLPPLTLKGKSDAVGAWRLLEVVPGPGRWAPRIDSPLVGRSKELETLTASLDRVGGSRTQRCVTVLGAAGVGKSRLTAEFVAGIADDVTVLRGRCLPYGEGITFWPIVEMLRDLTGISELDPPDKAVALLQPLLPDSPETVAAMQHLAALMGPSTGTPGIQETFWSVRILLEGLGSRHPVVVVLDDIHWAEPPLLDLIEYLADWLGGSPVLFVCLARPELLELRPGWMAKPEDSTILRLEPLSGTEISDLVQNLLGRTAVPEEITARIADTTEGNPLFVEETLRMLRDDGTLHHTDEGWDVAGDLSALSIPPTIHALLTARVDMLEPGERAVLERAAVIGRSFLWSAVAELSDDADRPLVGGRLQSLVHKQLIVPDPSESRTEDAFRFTHILVRDAAYRGIPKERRAELHERFARWLMARDQGQTEHEEIIGFHLESAHAALMEIGPRGDRVIDLGRQAAEPLGSAGRRAFARGDMWAAANLLSRTVSLLPSDEPSGTEVLPDLATALMQTGDFDRTRAVVERLQRAAKESGDDVLTAHATVIELWIRLFTQPKGWANDVVREAGRALSVFEGRNDDRGLSKSWTLLALSNMMRGQFGSAAGSWEQAADHAAAAEDHREELEHLAWIPIAVWCGPTTIAESIRSCEHVLERARGDRKVTAIASATIGTLEAMRGRFDEGRSLVSKAKAMLEEVHLPGWTGALTQLSGWVELLAGDPVAAERELRIGVELLRGIGELAWLSSAAAILAEALYEQGRLDDAERFTQESESAAGEEDVYSQALFRAVRAKIHAQEGHTADAVRVAREAVRIADGTDFTFLRVVASTALGEVLEKADDAAQGAAALSEAEELSEGIGFTVGAERARALRT